MKPKTTEIKENTEKKCKLYFFNIESAATKEGREFNRRLRHTKDNIKMTPVAPLLKKLAKTPHFSGTLRHRILT